MNDSVRAREIRYQERTRLWLVRMAMSPNGSPTKISIPRPFCYLSKNGYLRIIERPKLGRNIVLWMKNVSRALVVLLVMALFTMHVQQVRMRSITGKKGPRGDADRSFAKNTTRTVRAHQASAAFDFVLLSIPIITVKGKLAHKPPFEAQSAVRLRHMRTSVARGFWKGRNGGEIPL